MDTPAWRAPAASADLGDLRREVIEQVMRVTASEAAVRTWLEVPPASPAAHRALGRLLATNPFVLHATSPIAVWLAPGRQPVDPHWRKGVPIADGSLMAELRELERTHPHGCDGPCACSPYRRLEDAREHATG